MYLSFISNTTWVSFILKARFNVVITWPNKAHDLMLENMAVRQRSAATILSILHLLLVLLFSYRPVQAEISSAFIDKGTGQLSISEGYREDFVAWANFTDDIEKSGWVVVVNHPHVYNVHIPFLSDTLKILVMFMHTWQPLSHNSYHIDHNAISDSIYDEDFFGKVNFTDFHRAFWTLHGLDRERESCSCMWNQKLVDTKKTLVQ